MVFQFCTISGLTRSALLSLLSAGALKASEVGQKLQQKKHRRAVDCGVSIMSVRDG